MKTDRSPPEETNLVLSCALEAERRHGQQGQTTRASLIGAERERDLHRDGQNLVAVGRVGLDFCTQAGVPETDGSVLTTGEDVFRASLGVPYDVDGPFVIL